MKLKGIPQEAKDSLNLKNDHQIFEPKGCNKCNETGYSGRIGIFEVMLVTTAIKELIYKGTTTTEIRKFALEEGMISLLRDGMNKVHAGITSMEEVFAAAYEEV